MTQLIVGKAGAGPMAPVFSFQRVLLPHYFQQMLVWHDPNPARVVLKIKLPCRKPADRRGGANSGYFRDCFLLGPSWLLVVWSSLGGDQNPQGLVAPKFLTLCGQAGQGTVFFCITASS